MNKIISILICCFIAGCLFVSCEQPDIPDVPNYDKTEILTFKVYNQDKEEVGTPVILSDEGVVTNTGDEGTDLSNVFATCTLSSGATLSPALGGYQDWSGLNKEFTVTSASGKRSKPWTVIFKTK